MQTKGYLALGTNSDEKYLGTYLVDTIGCGNLTAPINVFNKCTLSSSHNKYFLLVVVEHKH